MPPPEKRNGLDASTSKKRKEKNGLDAYEQP